MRNLRLLRYSTIPRFKESLYLTVVLLILSPVSNYAKMFNLHWKTTNSMFHNQSNIIDVNKGNLPFHYDQVSIICPRYKPGTFDNETEKSIIYEVSKEEYEKCYIANDNARTFAICDRPQESVVFVKTFRPFTPIPGGWEFKPGYNYHFISTSSKDDIDRRSGGRCATNNMRIIFKVCCASNGRNDAMMSNNDNRCELQPLHFALVLMLIIIMTFN